MAEAVEEEATGPQATTVMVAMAVEKAVQAIGSKSFYVVWSIDIARVSLGALL